LKTQEIYGSSDEREVRLEPESRAHLSAGAIGVAVLGGVLLASATRPEGVRGALQSYLVAYCYVLTLALGALFFVTLQHLVRASWSVVVRRVAELVAAVLPFLALLALPVLAGAQWLYPWADRAAAAGDALLRHKQAFLNVPFFAARLAVYFGFWALWWLYLWRGSTRQDLCGDPQITVRLQKRSAPAMAGFALTLTFATFDLVMSLNPKWHSTILGVYLFSGCVVGSLALLIVAFMLLQWRGRLVEAVGVEHYHDLGKLLFAFVIFWAYIAYSQYMLIWYANLPEETVWYARRQEPQWAWMSVLLLCGHFLLPFVGLISPYAKRSRKHLGFWAVWLLIMHWVDIYWLMMPQLRPQRSLPTLVDLLCVFGLAALCFAWAAYLARGRMLIPVRDPRLADSLAFVEP